MSGNSFNNAGLDNSARAVFKEGSWVDDEATRKNLNSFTRNYPNANDTTQSGGYSAAPEQAWSDKSQRGGGDPYYKAGKGEWKSKNEAGLIDQSLNGTDLKNELEDAKQGNAGTDTPIAY
ncbi:hypothetical protein CYLTODRAFT_418461 [Cylindrobasidium torrendii FP15055 ss-10]|uniref:Uncharacterized protein n=1 Tax=Cylindrobasidium torrendii FP15055 ss-10 TaxID=1314674 RepID=A0A0D7BMY7_9AGAR|nr:hypothetical protein CYLTODRAFT_418461 [Cylindrobasidium torrendii FP15055 ss-10]